VTLAYGTASASTTSCEYSATGQLLQVIDPNSNETDYTYNEAGQELTEATPLSATAMTMTYNGQDQLVSKTDANGLIDTYSYTDGNLTEEKWYASNGTTLLDTLDWSYNC
jgi:YD repeat-containing protein